MDQRVVDLDRRFAATDLGAASEARRPLVVDPAAFTAELVRDALGAPRVMLLLWVGHTQNLSRLVDAR
jgi:hypothetical protein